ncbi:hypothetical protein A2U01_0020398, partial [Trifolium medium]|nr:hypothetical protein [Trifolium medium]
GFVNCVNLEIPYTTQKGSRVKNATTSGEALLRSQAKIIMEMPKKETLEILAPTSQIQNLSGISTSIVQQQSISQVANLDHDICEFRKCEITKSFDFSENFQASEECNSEASYEEITQGSGVGGCINYAEDDVERGIIDEEPKDEKKETDEVEQVHDFIRDSQHNEVVDFEIDDTKSAMVSNVINPNVQYAPLICLQIEATPITHCIVPTSKYHNESVVAFERIIDATTETQISEKKPLEVDTWNSQTSLIQYHDYYLISELDVSGTNSYMLTKVGQTSFCDQFPTSYAIFEEWDPGGNLDVLAQDWSSHFTQWDPGGWSLVHWRRQHAKEALYQDENSGSSSFEVEETD